MPDASAAGRRLRTIEPVVTGEPDQCELQDDFAGPLRPPRAALSHFETLQVAADVDENARKFGPYGSKST